MKTIEEVTTKVINIKYDDKSDCYVAYIEKPVLHDVYYGTTKLREKRHSVYIELSTVDCSNIVEGSVITIKTIERKKGEEIDLFSGKHCFVSDGISNIITNVN